MRKGRGKKHILLFTAGKITVCIPFPTHMQNMNEHPTHNSAIYCMGRGEKGLLWSYSENLEFLCLAQGHPARFLKCPGGCNYIRMKIYRMFKMLKLSCISKDIGDVQIFFSCSVFPDIACQIVIWEYISMSVYCWRILLSMNTLVISLLEKAPCYSFLISVWCWWKSQIIDVCVCVCVDSSLKISNTVIL